MGYSVHFGTPGNDASKACSNQAYCGYHNVTTSFPKNFVYGTIVYPDGNTCSVRNHGAPDVPPGDDIGQTLASVTAHEQFEAATDPIWFPNMKFTGWQDATGAQGEISDKCAWMFPSGSYTSLNGQQFAVQLQYSNATHSCVSSFSPQWTAYGADQPGNFQDTLYGLAEISATDAWAVGWDVSFVQGFEIGGPLSEHWNGTTWSAVIVPNVGPDVNVLQGVAAISSTNVWAVGTIDTATGSEALLEQWNGSQWIPQVAPMPSGAFQGDLDAITALPDGEAWAVGQAQINSPPYSVPLIEHYNGSVWTLYTNTCHSPGPITLYSVTAVSSNDVWAVGSYNIALPGGNSATQTLIAHWNGKNWCAAPGPGVTGSNTELRGVSAVSATNIWAVGEFFGPLGQGTLIEHWDGKNWSVVGTTGSGCFFGVAAVTATDVWAVGTSTICDDNFYPGPPVVAQMGETGWNVVPSPAGTGALFGLAVNPTQSTYAWGVGQTQPAAGGFAIIESNTTL